MDSANELHEGREQPGGEAGEKSEHIHRGCKHMFRAQRLKCRPLLPVNSRISSKSTKENSETLSEQA